MIRRLILCLLLPLAANGAIVRVGHAFTGGTSSTSSQTRTYAPTTGNTVFVGVTTWTTGTQPTSATMSDGGTNTYTLVGSRYDTVSSTSYIYRASNITGGSFTYTFTPNHNAWINLFVVEYSGLATTSAADGFVSAVGVGTSLSSGALSTSHSSDLLFSTFSSSESVTVNTFSAGSGWTMIDQSNGAVSTYGGVMEQIVSSTGSYTATATFNGSSGANTSTSMAATKGVGGSSGNKVSITIQ